MARQSGDMNTDNIWDAVIIGGGAAGLSAALSLGRARRRVVVIDAGQPRNRFAAHMQNVLGHDGLPPLDLLKRGREEIAAYGVEVWHETVAEVTPGTDQVEVLTDSGKQLTARRVVVTAGLSDELPAIEGLAERWGRDVFQCPYCHGYEVRDQHIGVIATGPMSLHHVQLVRQWSDRITFFSQLAGEISAEERTGLLARGIEIVEQPVARLVVRDDVLAGIETVDGEIFAVDAVATAARFVANDGFLARLEVERTQWPFGDFIAVDKMGKTSNDLIFAAGNVTNPGGVVVTAMAEGAAAGGGVNAALVTEDIAAAVRKVAA